MDSARIHAEPPKASANAATAVRCTNPSRSETTARMAEPASSSAAGAKVLAEPRQQACSDHGTYANAAQQKPIAARTEVEGLFCATRGRTAQIAGCKERKKPSAQQHYPQRRASSYVATARANRFPHVFAWESRGRPLGPPPSDHADERSKCRRIYQGTRPRRSVAARTAPPIAGPTARARFWLTEPNEIAWALSSGSTSSGCSVCQVGAVSAWPIPTPNISASRDHGETSLQDGQDAQRRGDQEHVRLCGDQKTVACQQDLRLSRRGRRKERSARSQHFEPKPRR